MVVLSPRPRLTKTYVHGWCRSNFRLPPVNGQSVRFEPGALGGTPAPAGGQFYFLFLFFLRNVSSSYLLFLVWDGKIALQQLEGQIYYTHRDISIGSSFQFRCPKLLLSIVGRELGSGLKQAEQLSEGGVLRVPLFCFLCFFKEEVSAEEGLKLACRTRTRRLGKEDGEGYHWVSGES